MDEIVSLCKRRGFVFPSSEIYGGLGSTYDYGHYGVLLKTNVKNEWWRSMLQERDDIVALDSAILQRPKVWEASGHLEGFTDPLVQCLGKCKRRWREDHLREAWPPKAATPTASSVPRVRRRPDRAAQLQPDVRDARRPGRRRGLGGLPPPRDRAGHLHQLQERARLRPQEAAVRHRPGRQVLPQRDHAGQLHLPHPRVRADGDGVLRPARRRRSAGTTSGSRPRALVHRPRPPPRPPARSARTTHDELSHYSRGTSDVEYLFPIGWSELEGIANRGDFDLTQHARLSGEKLEYFDQQTNERYVPHVIEPAAGADRATLAFLVDAYEVEEVEGRQRTVLRLHPRLAPVKVAVLPLVTKEGLPENAREIFAAPPQARPRRVRRERLDRQALPPPGRDRHPLLRHRRLPDHGGRHRHPPRPRHHRPGPRPGRGPRRRPGQAPRSTLAEPQARLSRAPKFKREAGTAE